MEIQRGGFRVVHCVKQAKSLSGKTPFARVLKSLDSMAQKDDERGKEAVVFADELRKWLAWRNADLLEMSETDPARSLIESESHLERLEGLDGAAALTARMEEIKGIKGIKTLIDAYEKRDKIIEHERAGGSGSRRRRLVKTLESYVLKEGLDETLLDEAERLLDEIRE